MQRATMRVVSTDPILNGKRVGLRAIADESIPDGERIGGATLELILPLPKSDEEAKSIQVGDVYSVRITKGSRSEGLDSADFVNPTEAPVTPPAKPAGATAAAKPETANTEPKPAGR